MAQRLGIDTHLRALRHYLATELLSAGVDLRTVAGRLGHGEGGATTLRVYAAWFAASDRKATELLGSRMPKRRANGGAPASTAPLGTCDELVKGASRVLICVTGRPRLGVGVAHGDHLRAAGHSSVARREMQQ